MAVRCLRNVPLVKPCEILRGSEVEPEVVEQPRCLGGPFLGLRGPAPRRIAERRVFRLGVVKFVAREPVEQIPVNREEVLRMENQVGMPSSQSKSIQLAAARTFSSSPKPDHMEGFRKAWMWRTVRPRSRARAREGAVPFLMSLTTVSASGSGTRPDRWESYQARSWRYCRDDDKKRMKHYRRVLACSSLRICKKRLRWISGRVWMQPHCPNSILWGSVK